MSDEKPTHMLVPIGAFRLFDAIADLALRQGGVEAMRLVQAFSEQVKPHTPVPSKAKPVDRKAAAELVAMTPPDGETGTD